MTISFNSIPLDLRTPGQYLEFDSSNAVSGLQAQPQRILIIGQKLATGIAPAAQSIRVLSPAHAIQRFGRGSMLAAMCAATIANNPVAEIWAFPLEDNPAGVAATKTLTLTGAATAAGTANLYIGGIRVQAAVAVADTPTIVAAALATAVNANPDIPATAAAVAGVVTFTARHKGEAGRDIDARLSYQSGEFLPTGLAAAFGIGVAGTGNPDLSTVFATIGDDWFNTIVLAYTDTGSLAVVEAELADRWGPLRMIEAQAYAFKSAPMGDLAAVGAARNSPHLSIGGLRGSLTPPWTVAAAYAGVVAFHAAIDPARPFQTLALKGVLAPKPTDRFTRAERDLLLRDGISTFTIDAGGNVLIERPITTYQTDAFGLEDTAYLDVNTVLTLAYLRWTARARVASKYGRHKLADDGTLYGEGQAIVTPKIIRAELVSLYRDWMDAGLVENIEAFKAALIVERAAGDPNRLNALIPPNLVNQFRIFAGQVQFRL
jgi:phage tail sheath gpL-like